MYTVTYLNADRITSYGTVSFKYKKDAYDRIKFILGDVTDGSFCMLRHTKYEHVIEDWYADNLNEIPNLRDHR